MLGSYLVTLGVYLGLAALAFWSDSRTGVVNMAWNLNQYGKYPVEVFNRVLRGLLTFVLPFVFVAAYPAGYFLRREAWLWQAALTPVAGVLCTAAALLVWRAGLRRYTGAGS